METLDTAIQEAGETAMDTFLTSDEGANTCRGEWIHNQSCSSAYWSPLGDQIVSTSYDNHLRCKELRVYVTILTLYYLVWTQKGSEVDDTGKFHSMRPQKQIDHNCKTVRFCVWLFEWVGSDLAGQVVNYIASTMVSQSEYLPSLYSVFTLAR